MLYEYECKKCGKELEAIRPIAMHDQGPECCGQMSKQVIRTAPYGFVDNMEEYRCPVTNQGVTSRRQRNDIMDRNYLIDANDLLQSDEARAKKTADVQAQRAKFKAEEPKEVRKQVDAWAARECGL